MSEKAKAVCWRCGLSDADEYPVAAWDYMSSVEHETGEDCITALRAALDQERADNAQLRYFATDIIEAVCAVDADGRPVGPLSDEIVLGMAVHRGLLHSPGSPTALLSGRGEGEGNG